MFRNLLILVLCLPSIVMAQQGLSEVNKPVVCGPADIVFGTLNNEWNEKPIWGSQLKDSKVVLLSNADTKSWSIVQFNDRTACVIETGEGYFLKVPFSGT